MKLKDVQKQLKNNGSFLTTIKLASNDKIFIAKYNINVSKLVRITINELREKIANKGKE